MATYSKGYKKQNSETVLLKVIIGVIIAVFVFVAIAFIFDSTTKWKEYDYFTNITEVDGINEYTNGGSEALEDYVVYIYADDCVNCTEIKTDLLKDGKKINKDSEMFFLANTDSMTDLADGLSDFLTLIDETELGTPMLLVIADGEVYEAYMGSSAVLENMDLIANGQHEAFND